MKLKNLLFGLVSLSLVSAAANADTQIYTVRLQGSQEVPPVVTSGTGLATVTLDDVTGAVSVSGNYENLSGSQTGAHIHGPAAPGANAGIIVVLTGTGGTTGTFSGSGTLTAGQITSMVNGLTYLNVHSTIHPGGEIRGQILFTPKVPALRNSGWLALGLFLSLAGGWVLVRSRRSVRA